MEEQNKPKTEEKKKKKEKEETPGVPPKPKKKEPEEWEHALFMRELPPDSHPQSVVIDAMSSLIYDDEKPEDIAEHFKNQGNELFKKGKKFYKDAILYYTQAIDQKSPIADNNSIYYSNRAAVQLLLGNWRSVIDDCKKAIELNPKNVKAYYRAAKAANEIEKPAEALEFCTKGLKQESDNKMIQTELKRAMEIKQKQEERARREQEAARKKKEELDNLYALIESRGVTMGEAIYNKKANKRAWDRGDSTYLPVLDAETQQLLWPVLFIYEEYQQTDFIERFNENDTFYDHLQMMFPPATPPLPWDNRGDYHADNLVIYFEGNAAVPLERKDSDKKKEEGKKKLDYLRLKPEKIKLDVQSSLGEALRHPSFIVPGYPVFYVMAKSFEKEFLRRELS